ncbi:ATP-binding protein [Paenibacillus hamazuiensis]|uniref:ATP-binding protein n=1 Tax=Paenibacillus hamazuiensis TaxID=2936508 RepID=UPI00200FA341|nr:ATP-binding protein [Paenibacillus hamazuiensis]
MQCMFIWMEKYRNFTQQGFNFGGPLRFQYDKDLRKLVVQSSPFHIEDFFLPSRREEMEPRVSKITNVTAIVGENGTGKSSLLEYMIHLLSPETYYEEFAQLIVFRDKMDHYTVYHSSSMDFEIDNRSKAWIFKQEMSELNRAQLPLSVYFSNIFDARRMPQYKRLIGYINQTHPEKIIILVTPIDENSPIDGMPARFSHFGDLIQSCRNELTSFYESNEIHEAEFIQDKKVLDTLNRAALEVGPDLSRRYHMPPEGHALVIAKLSLLADHAQQMSKPRNPMTAMIRNYFAVKPIGFMEIYFLLRTFWNHFLPPVPC